MTLCSDYFFGRRGLAIDWPLRERFICPMCGGGYAYQVANPPQDRPIAPHPTYRVCWDCSSSWRKNQWLGGPIALGAELGLQVRSVEKQ